MWLREGKPTLKLAIWVGEYCWCKKSCTGWYGEYHPIICRALYIPGNRRVSLPQGTVFFLPSWRWDVALQLSAALAAGRGARLTCLGRFWKLKITNTGTVEKWNLNKNECWFEVGWFDVDVGWYWRLLMLQPCCSDPLSLPSPSPLCSLHGRVCAHYHLWNAQGWPEGVPEERAHMGPLSTHRLRRFVRRAGACQFHFGYWAVTYILQTRVLSEAFACHIWTCNVKNLSG